ncbi:MAG TPA: response regulator transcription factor [Acidimicrobiales bacterium]|nr:response regulator transcription factor [Acidimicrobiales bacterium]
MTIRVLIADDQQLVREGFRLILERQDDIEVVADVSDGAQAVAAAESLRPDVILMDIRMPHVDGIQAIRTILSGTDRDPPRVLVLTTFDLDEYVYDALQAGATGFLLKDVPPEQLVAAVRTARAGDALFSTVITQRLIETFTAARRPRPEAEILGALSAREVDVFRLLARGRSNLEIAETLFLAETTVKSHVAHILLKLDLRDRIQAAIYAYEQGLVQPGDGAGGTAADAP